MTIRTEFIDFIVSRSAIDAKYPGGWSKLLSDYGLAANKQRARFWRDDYLFRDGAMNPLSMKSIVDRWEEKGFVGLREVDGKRIWVDYCVYEGMWPSEYECAWLVQVDEEHVRHVDDSST